MCEECSVDKVMAVMGKLQEALSELDAEGEHAAAALVAQAVGILERQRALG